jgi:hypothetical protein
MSPLPTKWIQKASAVIAAALGVFVAGGASGASTLNIIPPTGPNPLPIQPLLDIMSLIGPKENAA